MSKVAIHSSSSSVLEAADPDLDRPGRVDQHVELAPPLADLGERGRPPTAASVRSVETPKASGLPAPARRRSRRSRRASGQHDHSRPVGCNVARRHSLGSHAHRPLPPRSTGRTCEPTRREPLTRSAVQPDGPESPLRTSPASALYATTRGPRSASPVLWEIGETGATSATSEPPRPRLRYLSRLLRRSSGSYRPPTSKGRHEREELDRRSDDLARSSSRCDRDRRLVGAMQRWSGSSPRRWSRSTSSIPATAMPATASSEYFAELDRRFDRATTRTSPAAPAHEMRPPAGGFLSRRCGASRWRAAGEAPRPTSRPRSSACGWRRPPRGLGVGRRMLGALEACAAAGAARRAARDEPLPHRGDRHVPLVGYLEVEAFNDEPYGDHWFEKPLAAERQAALGRRRERSGHHERRPGRGRPAPARGRPSSRSPRAARPQVGGFRVRRALPHRTAAHRRRLVLRRPHGPGRRSPTDPASTSARTPTSGCRPSPGCSTASSSTATASAPSRSSAPGQLNLMTAGHGVSHAEEATGTTGASSTACSSGWRSRRRPATARRPSSTTPSCRRSTSTRGVATVLVGELGGASVTGPPRHRPRRRRPRPPARRDHVPLDPTFEHALVVLRGRACARRRPAVVEPGQLALPRLRPRRAARSTADDAQRAAHRRRAVRRAGADVVELRRPHPRRDQPSAHDDVDGRRRPLRRRRVDRSPASTSASRRGRPDRRLPAGAPLPAGPRRGVGAGERRAVGHRRPGHRRGAQRRWGRRHRVPRHPHRHQRRPRRAARQQPRLERDRRPRAALHRAARRARRGGRVPARCGPDRTSSPSPPGCATAAPPTIRTSSSPPTAPRWRTAARSLVTFARIPRKASVASADFDPTTMIGQRRELVPVCPHPPPEPILERIGLRVVDAPAGHVELAPHRLRAQQLRRDQRRRARARVPGCGRSGGRRPRRHRPANPLPRAGQARAGAHRRRESSGAPTATRLPRSKHGTRATTMRCSRWRRSASRRPGGPAGRSAAPRLPCARAGRPAW